MSITKSIDLMGTAAGGLGYTAAGTIHRTLLGHDRCGELALRCNPQAPF